MRRSIAFLALLVPLALAPVASAQERHEHSANMSHVKNLPYAVDNGGTPNYGTDIEFATLAGKKYALAGSYKNGMQIVDISNPDDAEIVSTYDCGVTQGDVQVFRQADEPGRTFVGYASDTFGDGTSTCYREAQALGFDMLKADGTGKNGTFIADVTDPLNPEDRRLRRGRPGLAQPDDPPERQLPLQLQLGPDHVDPARDRGLRHLQPRRPEGGRRAHAPAASGPRHRVARHHVLRRRQARLLGRALPGRDHRHARPRQPVDHLVLPGPVDQRLAPDGPVHDRPTRAAASASS